MKGLTIEGRFYSWWRLHGAERYGIYPERVLTAVRDYARGAFFAGYRIGYARALKKARQELGA